MTPQEIDRIENAIRHIQTAADVDPWACDIAVEAMKTQLSAEGTTSDLISRHAAVDRINKQREHLQPDIYPQDKIGDAAYRICAEFIERLPSAQPEIEERTEESAQNVPKEDLISRKAVIDALVKAIRKDPYYDSNEAINGLGVCDVRVILNDLPSAQPEIKPISYQDCANAMMMMWMDDVLTDGEYRRIMDKLNDHENGKENR